jgi:Ssp1 endopeptidase immunity protein Rap1a
VSSWWLAEHRKEGLSMKRYGTGAWLLLVAVVILGQAAVAWGITADEFRLRSGADIVALCATPASDALYTAATHMCHGFGAGTFQTLVALTRHDKLEPLICPPQPTPSRNETVARFLEWAKQNPQYLTDPAVEVVGRFFITTFPCRAN